MRWRLRLYCGHVVERTAHQSHRTIHSAFTGSTACPECGLEPATVVAGEALGLAGEPPRMQRTTAPAPSKSDKPTKAELQAEVVALRAEVKRLRKG